MTDDGAALCHAADTDRQRDAHRCRQAFGDGADGQRHGCHQHGRHRFTPQHTNHKGECGKTENDPQQQAGKFAHLLRQRRGDFRRASDQARDPTGFGGVRRGDDEAVALTGDHGGAGIGHVAAVCERSVSRQFVVALVDRRGLAGELGFNGAQLAAGNDA